MKYAHIIDNKLQGWYDSEIHTEIPTPNIEVTDEVWQEAININANCYEDGKFIVKDFRTDEEIENQRISQIKSKAQSLILSKYSLEKQSSAQLGIYGEEYLQEMKDYISNIIRISNEAESNGTQVEDILWLW